MGLLPVVPGTQSYSEVGSGEQKDAEKAAEKTSIFSTSITRDIDQRDFNRKYKGSHAFFHKFHGGKARHMKGYVHVHMDEDKPDNVVILAGGNDLDAG